MQYFKKVVGGGTEDVEQLKADLKKRGDMIEKLKDKAKKLMEEKDFVNKSYEELEKKYMQL
jgi:hypothetical protein